MSVIGIDPGVVRMGLAEVRRGRWVASATFRGASGCSTDSRKLAVTAALQADRAVAWVQDRDPAAIAIETMVDQGKRRRFAVAHTTAAAVQALWDAFSLAGMSDLVTFQDAADVLRHGKGYGDLHYLLTVGRAGIDAPGALNEHEASAVTHAAWLETARHSPMAGAR